VNVVAETFDVNDVDLDRLINNVGMIAVQREPAILESAPTIYDVLCHIDIHGTTEAYLADWHLKALARGSDPDLPRLMLLANGLAHHVPPDVMATVPAHSTAPFHIMTGRTEERYDLVGWAGIDRALNHLREIHDAARAGREWMARTRSSAKQAVDLALGVLDLTHPDIAAVLVPDRGYLAVGDIHGVCQQYPTGASPAELSDQALGAACHRNGWLLGTPEEYDAFRSVQRHVTALFSPTIRRRFATGDTASVWPLASGATYAAGAHPFLNPRHPERIAVARENWFLNSRSRKALETFTSLRGAEPRQGLWAAITGRFPDRLVRPALDLAPLDGPHPAAPPPAGDPNASVPDPLQPLGIGEAARRLGHQPPPSAPGLEVDL
jgi:hypothetical protein